MSTYPATSTRQLIAQLSPTLSGGTSVSSLYSESCFINPTPSKCTYYIYEIEVMGLQPSDNSSWLGVQFYDTNQTLITYSFYNTEGFSTDAGSFNRFNYQAISFIGLHNAGMTPINANETLNASIRILNPSNLGVYKSINANVYSPQAYNGYGCTTVVSGAYLGSNAAIGGISFSFYNSSYQQQGNITSGLINIYGILDAVTGS